MTSKIIYGGVVLAALLGLLAFAGYSPFLKTVVNQFGTTAGSAGTRRIAEFTINPTTASATSSSSLINSDGNDRVITSADVMCSGLGTSLTAYTGAALSSLIFSIATTSTSAPIALGNSNFIYNGTIATSSVTFYDASSTPGLTSSSQIGVNRRWPTSTYLTVTSNATNTAACVVNINYLQGLGI